MVATMIRSSFNMHLFEQPQRASSSTKRRRRGHCWRILATMLLVIPQWSCGMWIPVLVCRTPTSAPNLMSVSIFPAGSWSPDGSKLDMSHYLYLGLRDQGHLTFSYGNDSWCKDLDAAQLETIEHLLAQLDTSTNRRSQRMKKVYIRDEIFVDISFGGTVLGGETFPKTATWSRSFPQSEATLKSFDQIFCTLEGSLGRAYRRAITTDFKDFLDARGRDEPCAQSSHPST